MKAAIPAVMLLACAACAAPGSRPDAGAPKPAAGAPASAPSPIPADFEASVGSGGGVAGTWRTARLRADGSLVVELGMAGRPETTLPAGRLPDEARLELWTILQAARLESLGCVPSNMTEQVEMIAGGVTRRACAPMGGGSPEFRRLFGQVQRLIGEPTAGVQAPPPPHPPLPKVLVLEASSPAGRWKVARAGEFPGALAQGAVTLDDAGLQPLWDAVFDSRFYGGASIESRDGVALPGAPFSCGEDVGLRVTSGDGTAWETRRRCAEGDATILALAESVKRAGS